MTTNHAHKHVLKIDQWKIVNIAEHGVSWRRRMKKSAKLRSEKIAICADSLMFDGLKIDDGILNVHLS